MLLAIVDNIKGCDLMNNKQWQEMYNTATNVLNEIDFDNIKENDFLLGGAALAYLNNKMMFDDAESNPVNIIGGVDFIPDSVIDEKKIESLKYFIAYMNEKSSELIQSSSVHGEMAFNAFKKMLEADNKVLELLWQTASQKEREEMKKLYRNICEKMK